MKARISLSGATILSLLFMALVCGCKSTPKIDWNSRVGNYTYDQAVHELGPPDKSTTLTDGKLVADWITRTSSGSVSFGFGTGVYGGSGGTAVGVGQTVPTGYREKILRLTFGGENYQLVSWWKNY